MTGAEILELKFFHPDLCDEDEPEITIRDFLKSIVEAVIIEGEGFSGKRPFGNSGWDYPVALALVQAGVIEGEIIDPVDDEDEPYVNNYEEDQYELAMIKAIAAL